MNCVIFCGGFGTRMNNGEPGALKPLIEVAGKEILAHIISIYESQNVTKFILLGGYKIDDLYDFAKKYSNSKIKINVIDTGSGTATGGRLLKIKDFITENTFLLTYGDSVTNFNLTKAQKNMSENDAEMSISTFRKKLEYGVLDINDKLILNEILEKTYSVPINAGFYILNKKIFEYINSLEESFEIDVLPRILKEKKINFSVYEVSFWHPMDTPEDRTRLNKLLLNYPNTLFE